MDRDVTVGGDSGGPWYKVNKGYGGHHGACGNTPSKDAFSVLDLFDEALDIDPIIYE